jgi:hypothetical protein
MKTKCYFLSLAISLLISSSISAFDATTFMCNDTTIYLDQLGIAAIDSSFVNGGSNGDGSFVSMVVSPESFNCSAIGINVMILTVTDTLGLSDQCSSNVTVLDTILD